MKHRRFIIAAAACLMLAAGFATLMAHARPKGDWIQAQAEGLRYQVLLPADYHPDRRYPLVLYLHQLDMGDDQPALTRQVDAWFATPAFRTRHKAIVVVPMLDQRADPGGKQVNFGGKAANRFGETQTIDAVRDVMARYKVDPDRVYVTGNSLGGMGTWEMLLAYNSQTGTKGHIFAAGMPLAGRHGTADPAAAAHALATVPIWSFHGARDPEVGITWDRTMARLLAGHPTFHYTEEPNLAHDVWDSIYPRQDVWQWLFSQSAVRSTSASGTPPAGSASSE